jgi:hypothetical protein
MAELYQYCHTSSGIANPVTLPYYVAAAYPRAFIDVIYGSDQYQNTTPYYIAKKGYDDASGLGVPYGMAFANTVCPSGTKAPGVQERSAMMAAAAPQQSPSQTLDVTPRAPGVSDLGERSTIANTQVQVVLRSESDRQAVEAALEQAGFRINRTEEYDRIVNAQAPSGTVESFFRTRMHDVAQLGYGTRYLPATQIALPDALAPRVITVSLDNVVTRHVLSRRALPFTAVLQP